MQNVFLYKVDAMKQILNYVSKGYNRYISGEIEVKKLSKLALKFDDLYKVDLPNHARFKRKVKGEANSHLIMLYNPSNEKNIAYWWLLVSEVGDGLVVETQNLIDAKNKKNRIVFNGFELLRTQRVENLPSKKFNEKEITEKPKSKVRWSWKCNNDLIELIKLRSKWAASNKNEMEIRQIIYNLNAMPCFHESRKQAYDCYSFLSKIYKKQFGKPIKEVHGEFRKNFYGRYKKATTITLDKVTSKSRVLKYKESLVKANSSLKETNKIDEVVIPVPIPVSKINEPIPGNNDETIIQKKEINILNKEKFIEIKKLLMDKITKQIKFIDDASQVIKKNVNNINFPIFAIDQYKEEIIENYSIFKIKSEKFKQQLQNIGVPENELEAFFNFILDKLEKSISEFNKLSDSTIK